MKTVIEVYVNQICWDAVITHTQKELRHPEDPKYPIFTNPEKTKVKCKGKVIEVTLYVNPKAAKRGFITFTPSSINRLAKAIQDIESTETEEDYGAD